MLLKAGFIIWLVLLVFEIGFGYWTYLKVEGVKNSSLIEQY